MAGTEQVGFDRLPVADGDELAVSQRLRLDVVATPGHTFHHLAYVLRDRETPVGVFTGGSLLFGTTGRTDLLGARHAHALAEQQHRSVRRLAELLPDSAQVWPTHGFGSFCSATQADAPGSTMGRERTVNPALCLEPHRFVVEALAGLDAYPAYYAQMGARNAAGVELIDLTPARPVGATQLRDRIDAGEWVVDLRSRKAFARQYLTGTVSVGLDGPMSTWLGWLPLWGAPITLLGESREQVGNAQRELARVGIERPAATAAGAPEQWAGADRKRLGELPTATFAELAVARGGNPVRGLPGPDVVLDVRMGNEWRGEHLEGAVHVPLPELPTRLEEVPAGTVWVHCGSGYRAAIGASLLARAGRQVVLIDDAYSEAAAAGLTVVPGTRTA